MSRWLFLSPHLDDAVLSCGGLIGWLSSDCTVTVASVFTGAPWFGPYSGLATWLHNISGYRRARPLFRARRSEDRTATARLGANFRHLSFRDSVYRKGKPGQWLYQSSVQTTPKPDDEELIERLGKSLKDLCQGYDFVICPLGIGGHVDHRIVRIAAERHSLPHAYYPDIPYVWMTSKNDLDIAPDLHRVAFTLSDACTTAWLCAVQDYRSQLRMLDGAVGCLTSKLKEHAALPQELLFRDSSGAREICRELQTIRAD